MDGMLNIRIPGRIFYCRLQCQSKASVDAIQGCLRVSAQRKEFSIYLSLWPNAAVSKIVLEDVEHKQKPINQDQGR